MCVVVATIVQIDKNTFIMGTLATKSVQNVLVIEKPGLGVVTSRSSSLVLPLWSARKLLELIAQNFFAVTSYLLCTSSSRILIHDLRHIFLSDKSIECEFTLCTKNYGNKLHLE